MADRLRVLITDEDPDSRVITRKALERARLAVAVRWGTAPPPCRSLSMLVRISFSLL